MATTFWQYIRNKVVLLDWEINNTTNGLQALNPAGVIPTQEEQSFVHDNENPVAYQLRAAIQAWDDNHRSEQQIVEVWLRPMWAGFVAWEGFISKEDLAIAEQVRTRRSNQLIIEDYVLLDKVVRLIITDGWQAPCVLIEGGRNGRQIEINFR